MKQLRFLVTAVGGDLGQSVVRCLKDAGYRAFLVGCDMNPYAAGQADVDAFYQAPPVRETEEYISFLRQTIETEAVDYVFPMSDPEIIFVNENRHVFDDCPAAFIVNDQKIISTFMDKFQTIEFFKEKGIPYPQTWLPGDYKGQLNFPVILKKRRGSGSQSLFKVNDGEELQFYLKRGSDMLIQEYLPGEDNEYTSGLFSDGKTVYTITFKRKLAPGGFSQHVELVTDPTIAAFTRQVTHALDVNGYLDVNVQFRVTEKGCVPFEINPRFSSTVYFRHRFGFTDVLWSLALHMGQTISYSPRYTSGIGVRKFTETFFQMEK
jgi:carbamoyl-phosphate synthase large subunit